MDLESAVRCARQGGLLAADGEVMTGHDEWDNQTVEQCAHWRISCSDCDTKAVRSLINRKSRVLTEQK